MKEPERSFLYGVRVGQSSLQECLTRCGELERELEDLLDNPYLPDVPDVATVENWMLDVYQKEWE